MSYIMSPQGDLYSTFRIGGSKAFDGGFVILGTGADEVIEYVECPTTVAIAWRDHLAAILMNHRPGRRIPSIEWLELAAEHDPEWAQAKGWEPPPPPSSPKPQRPRPSRPTEEN